MTSAETSRAQRSYDRNLGWCRFWLGVSLAVATITFTFAVDQVFDLSSERVNAAVGELNCAETNDPTDPIRFSKIAVMLTLGVISGLCVGLSARFRILYQRDDQLLAVIDHPNQEATP